MASIFKRGGKGAKGYWYVQWFDHTGKRHSKCTKTTDKATANRMARKYEVDAALRREGVIDAAAEEISQQAQRPLAEHLDDFENKLRVANRSPDHVQRTVGFIRAIAVFAGFRVVADISADAVNRYAGSLRSAGLSARTIQARLTAVKSFTRWLAAEGKLPRDPLTSVRRPSPQADRRYRRRMLQPGEWLWLRTATQTGPDRCGMPGAERTLLYRTAIETGLRSGELRSLTRGRLHLTGCRPYVTCGSADTKNGQQAQQFVTKSLAVELSEHVVGKAPTTAVFNMPHETNVARMLRADLTVARAQWLAEAKADPQLYAEREASDFLTERNHDGEVMDFHSLRHTCGAWLALTGEQPKVIQTVMRHSQITLTLDTYGHLMPGATADAVGRLDSLLTATAGSLRATGAETNTACHAQQQAQHSVRESRLRGASECAARESAHNKPIRQNPLHSAELSDHVRGRTSQNASRPGGIRTPDQGIMSHSGTLENAEENGDQEFSAAQGAAVDSRLDLSDPELQSLIEQWPTLPAAVKARIVAMVLATGQPA